MKLESKQSSGHHLARAEHLDQAREAGDRVAVLAARTEAAAAQVYKL